MSTHDYGTPADEKEQDALADVLGQSFGHPAEATRERFPAVGLENIRVYRAQKKIVGGLWLVPMGQWFGGKSVPMTGIAAVGVAPEQRGRGVALRLMNRTIEDLHEQGVALSTLYPATQTLYRKSGYEQAGSRFAYTVVPSEIAIRDHSLPIRETTVNDRKAVKESYHRYARRLDGHLDRGPYIWDRVFAFRDQVATGFVVEDDGLIAGYVYFLRKTRDPWGFGLLVTDLVAGSAEAGRTLLSFLSDHRSMSPEASWHGGPANPLFTLFPEQRFTMKLHTIWMTRIVNVAAALEARGYPAGTNAELHLDIRDEILPGNNRRFVLEVSTGQGRVRQGGKGKLAMDIRGLAPLYTGFLSPLDLLAAGMIEGDVADLHEAQGVFAGPTPSMSDMF